MQHSKVLSSSQLSTALKTLSKWRVEGKSIVTRAKFPGFSEAFAFMTAAAALSEEMDHHPDWSNCYNSVSVGLSTHSSGGITQKDIDWALRAEKLMDKATERF